MKTVILTICSNTIHAHIIQGLLENENIPSILHNDISSSMLPYSAGGGVAILVYERDYDKARKIYEATNL